MVDKKAQQTFEHILSRDDQVKKAFLDRLGKDYPEPRAEMEGDAFVWLRQWWSPAQIQQFIDAHNADKMVYPGIINTSKGPGLEKFVINVDLLAFGAYARTLPRSKMLEMVAGRKAAHGEKFGPKDKRFDPFRRVLYKAFMTLPKGASNREALDYMTNNYSSITEEDGSIFWELEGKSDSMAWSTFRDRCTRIREIIRK